MIDRGQSISCRARARIANDEMVYPWRAVDHEGEIFESYITKTRDKAAALTFMRRC